MIIKNELKIGLLALWAILSVEAVFCAEAAKGKEVRRVTFAPSVAEPRRSLLGEYYSDPKNPRDTSPEATANLQARRDGALIDDPICFDQKRKEALWRVLGEREKSLEEAKERLSRPNPNTEGDFGFADRWARKRREDLLAARIRARWALEARLQVSAKKDSSNKILCSLC